MPQKPDPRFLTVTAHDLRGAVGVLDGAMKELPLTNIVSDSKGQIFASKRGELRFVIEDGDKGTWIKGEQKTELTNVPVEDNIALIYGELGVYEGSLGTPCDEY